jgi:hypothetical protein
MNVFGEENGEFVFVSAWSNYREVSEDHRNITYDLEGQRLAEEQGSPPTGNAVDIAKSMGVDLADPKFHEQLWNCVSVNGRAWLKTDDATRKTTGDAFCGRGHGYDPRSASSHIAYCSFRAALRVKKLSI